MNTNNIIEVIKSRFGQNGNPAKIPLLKGDKVFIAELCDKGVYVDNLGTTPFLPWDAFIETVSLLERNRGSVLRGNAISHKLGDSGLTLDSVEGKIAHLVYNKRLGDSVFRRLTPVACILIWSGICKHEPNRLILI